MAAGLRAALLAALMACSASSFARGEASPSAAGGPASAARPAVARALLDEARQAAGIGDWGSAAACLDEAAAQDPGDADVLYLRALAAVKRGLPYAPALGDLDAALGTGRFAYYSRRDASVLKAELLVRERRWKEGLDALGIPGSESVADPAYRLVRARALAGMGDARGFALELGEDLRRFPDDSAFARLFLARAGAVPPSEQARALGDTILGRLPRYAAADPELQVLAAPLMPSLAARRDAVLAYRASGGRSAKASLRALEYGLLDEAAASSELLSGSSPVALEDLASLLALAGSPAGRLSVLSALSAWSGEVLVDADSDGIYEGRFSLAKGLVREWSRDSRQEGIVDARASFLEGLPTAITLDRPGVEIEIEYSTYPAASTISFARKGERRSYAFGPEAFPFAPLAMRPFGDSGKDSMSFPHPLDPPDPSERACAASALSVETASGDDREVVLLEKGLPISAVAYTGGRILSRRSYENGRPVLERVDADGDGRFETEKGFVREGADQGADGAWKVAWIRSDSDGDGVFEYFEQTVFPFLKEWDYDGNGSVDARQSRLADGSMREEFSSRLDGRMDEEVVVREGRIISFSRNGARIDLIPDANRQLTWIGRKPFDLGQGLPGQDGIFSHMGKRYRLIRIGAFAFAELIP
jgi:hypothetical protein